MKTFNTYQKISGIPAKYREFRPSDNEDKTWAKAYEDIIKIVESESDAIIGIIGQRGGGKTQLASCVGGFVLVKAKASLKYSTAFDIFLSIRDAMKNGNEVKTIRKFTSPFLLVIDAFEVTHNSDYEARYLDHIIDTRYNDLKPTIIIANLKEKDLLKKIGHSNASRLEESGFIVNLKTVSKRKKYK